MCKCFAPTVLDTLAAEWYAWFVDARTLIDKLGLTPLPVEGGYFVETYRCDEVIGASALDGRALGADGDDGRPGV